MIDDQRYEEQVRSAMHKAASDALERKRRLGQYAVVWRDGKPAYVGPHPPTGSDGYRSNKSAAPPGVGEALPDDRGDKAIHPS